MALFGRRAECNQKRDDQMNEIEIMRHIEWIIDKLKKSSTATYYLETDWVTLPRIITLTEAINLRKELKKL